MAGERREVLTSLAHLKSRQALFPVGAIMKQILGAIFFSAFFAFVGLAAERASIPPFNLLKEGWAPIIFAVIGLAVGFWLANR